MLITQPSRVKISPIANYQIAVSLPGWHQRSDVAMWVWESSISPFLYWLRVSFLPLGRLKNAGKCILGGLGAIFEASLILIAGWRAECALSVYFELSSGTCYKGYSLASSWKLPLGNSCAGIGRIHAKDGKRGYGGTVRNYDMASDNGGSTVLLPSCNHTSNYIPKDLVISVYAEDSSICSD